MSGPFGETRVVDAHQHFWDLSRDDHPWLRRPAPGSEEDVIRRRYFKYQPKEYLEEVKPLRVAASVHVEASWNVDDPVGETRWLQHMHDSGGWPTAIVGAVQLEAPDARKVLTAHARHPAFRGVRDPLGWSRRPEFRLARAPSQMADPAWRKGFALLQPLGLRFDMQVFPWQLTEAADLASDFPDTAIVLDHCGSPDELANDRDVWKEGIARLANCANVYVKVSGISHSARSPSDICEYTTTLIERFGCERIMFGSNLPIEELGGSLATLIEGARAALSSRSDEERDGFWGGNAARFYALVTK
ncbi:amidohydrolase family protein [Aeromicrobium sp.]|uniref:amidohydrolase family protein n=1 Tax=Aeromicrobium sp. TaxID=1871063 RepID=UPI002FC8A45E